MKSDASALIATPARIIPGHRVASGLNGDPRFPGGTVRMQWPSFASLGLDLSSLHPGTVNVSVAPRRFRLIRPRHVFKDVRWHPTEPAEHFSFCDCWLRAGDEPPARGWIYHPHPETKPEHFQSPETLELLLPWMPGLSYGMEIVLLTDPLQIEVALP